MSNYLVFPSRSANGNPAAIAISESDVLSLHLYLQTMQSLPIAELVTEADMPYWDISDKFKFDGIPEEQKITVIQDLHLPMLGADVSSPTGKAAAKLSHDDDIVRLASPYGKDELIPLARFHMDDALQLASDSPVARTHRYLDDNHDKLISNMRDDLAETQSFEPVFNDEGELVHVWVHERRFAEPSELNLDEQGNTLPSPSHNNTPSP